MPTTICDGVLERDGFQYSYVSKAWETPADLAQRYEKVKWSGEQGDSVASALGFARLGEVGG